MSCVPPAMLIHEQSGEHGVALGSELLSLLPLSFHYCPVVTSCLPLALPHSSSCPMPALKPEMQLRCRVCNLLLNSVPDRRQMQINDVGHPVSWCKFTSSFWYKGHPRPRRAFQKKQDFMGILPIGVITPLPWEFCPDFTVFLAIFLTISIGLCRQGKRNEEPPALRKRTTFPS